MLQNLIFEDDIILEGVWLDDAGGGWRVISSQKNVKGEPASIDEIANAMEALGFSRLSFRGIGRAGALAVSAGRCGGLGRASGELLHH